jgi:hypothetical protein
MSRLTRAELTAYTSLDAIAHHGSIQLFLERAAEAGALVPDQAADVPGRLFRKRESVPLGDRTRRRRHSQHGHRRNPRPAR